MLNARNLRSSQLCKKLDNKLYSPFCVIQRIGKQAYKLALPQAFKIHNVFHVNLLVHHAHGTRVDSPLSPTVVHDQDGMHKEYEVEAILSAQMVRKCLKYQIKWKGYHDVTLEPAETILEDIPNMITAFHRANPFTLRL